MAYLGNTPGVSSQRYVQRETVSGSPKSAFIVSTGYSLGYVDVFVNGVQLDESEFTASDGVTVTLAVAAAVGDIVRIIAWLPRGLSDGYLKSEADARFSLLTDASAVANGVVYRNGSKRLTTGSALTFDGSQLGINCTAVTPFRVQQAGANDAGFEFQRISATNIGLFSFNRAGSAYTDFSIYGSNFIWLNSGTEAMRLTSTGLGIGTSSPGYKLQVYNNINGTPFAWGNATRTGFLYQDQSGVGITNAAGTGFDEGVYLDTANSKVVLYTNSTERATIDSSGNLGLGVTPSAKLHVGGIGYFGTTGASDTQLRLGPLNASNTYFQAISTDGTTAKGYVFYTGSTQAMTLDASGNLLLGQTSATGARLTVTSGEALNTIFTTSRASGAYLQFQLGNGGTNLGYLGSAGQLVAGGSVNNFALRAEANMVFSIADTERARIDAQGNLGLGVTPSAWAGLGGIGVLDSYSWAISTDGAANASSYSINAYYNGTNWIYKRGASASRYLQSAGSHQWFTAPSGTAGNAISFTQAMTLDASGNLGVGQTSPSGKLDIRTGTTGNYAQFIVGLSGGSSIYYDANTHYFRDGSFTERARIDSSGNLLVGGTSPNESFAGVPSVQGVTNCIFTNRRSSTSAASQFRFYNPNGLVGQIETNGSSTSYATTSDYRLKENIQPMTGALAKVQALKPCTYNWKADGSDGEGFIAHELQEVVPGCVTGEKDAVDADGNPVYQGIDTSFLVATLTAAIQELKAEFDAYKASHP